MKFKVWSFVWAVVLSGVAFGAEIPGKDDKVPLAIGDPAPPLKVGKWLQGGPYDRFEKGKVYMVEFWATWCAVCKQQIPHVNEIYKKYSPRGLNVMAISIAEEDQKLVPSFVKQMGATMTYPVAVDEVKGETGTMDSTWMDASANNELPKVFLINRDGVIAYLGSPTTLHEETIEALLANKIDVKAERETYLSRRANKKKIEKLENDIEAAAAAKEWTKAEQLMDEIEKLTPKDDLDSLTLSRISLAFKKKDPAAAEKLASALAAKSQDDIRVLDSLAWVMSLETNLSAGSMEIANKAIKRAMELGKDKDASVLETAARIQFIKGDKSEAMITQQKAVEAAAEEKRPHFEKVLKAYKEGHLPEE